METLKFLMVSTHFPPLHLGGDAVFVNYLAEELSARGHEVQVLHNPGIYQVLRGSKESPHLTGQADRFRITPYLSRRGSTDLFLALCFGSAKNAGSSLSSIIRDFNPDVVHWHNTKGFFGNPIHFPGRQSLYTSHDYYSVCPRSNLLRPDMRLCKKPKACILCNLRWRKPPPIWRTMSRRVMEIPTEFKVISPSEFVARRLEADGIQIHKVVPNFVPDRSAQDLADRPPSEDLVVYVGMLEAHKGVGTLLDAFSMRKDEHGFQLMIAGDGTLRRKLDERIDVLGIRDRAKILGFLPRSALTALRIRAAIQVLPSEWYENAPLTALEALSMGIPLIGSEIGGIPEIVDAGSGGTVYPPGDTVGLAQCLVDAWNRRDEYAEKQEMARAAYLRKFTPDVHIGNYLRIVRN